MFLSSLYRLGTRVGWRQKSTTGALGELTELSQELSLAQHWQKAYQTSATENEGLPI